VNFGFRIRLGFVNERDFFVQHVLSCAVTSNREQIKCKFVYKMFARPSPPVLCFSGLDCYLID